MNASILKELPKEITAGMQVVSFSRKNTDKQPVTEAERFRCVQVPAFSYTVTATPENAQQVFASVLADVVATTAGEILKDFCIANKYPTEIDAELLSFAKVLERMEQSQTSERLNAEQIAAWYEKSATKTDAEKRYGSEEKGKKQQAALQSRYCSLASNNPGIPAELATKLLSYLSEADTTNAVCQSIAKKLARLQKVTVDPDEL